SNPNADDSQQLTWGEKIGAGIVGVALLGGAVAGGYKYYQGRQERIAKQQGDRASRDGTDYSIGGGGNGEESKERSTGTGKATETTGGGNGASSEVGGSNVSDDRAPGWRQKASDSLSCLRSGGWSLAQGAYDLVTLKSCRLAAKPVEAAPEKPLMVDLTEVRTAQLKAQLADKLAQRPFLTKIYDLVALKQHALPSDQTERQQHAQEMARLGKMPISQVILQQQWDFNTHKISKEERAANIKALTTQSALEEITTALDPETAAELGNLERYFPISSVYPRLDVQAFTKFAYFVAKNSDDIHPGHLKALASAFQSAQEGDENEESQALLQKINEAVEVRWQQNNER
ncbi:MAG: hypothetical protein WCO92_05475, partial [Verrucomicrobiota bacterium]